MLKPTNEHARALRNAKIVAKNLFINQSLHSNPERRPNTHFVMIRDEKRWKRITYAELGRID